jgi:hydrogenase maturation protease
VAIGNTLRTDDGAGHVLAAALEPHLQASGLPVQRIDLHQLVPETAEDIAEAGMVVFLDAAVGEQKIYWRAVERSNAVGSSPHSLSPENIMTLVEKLYGFAPPAFLLSVPGMVFSHGEGLSRKTSRFVDEAVAQVAQIIGAYQNI